MKDPDMAHHYPWAVRDRRTRRWGEQLMQLTSEIANRYAGGQIEVQNAAEGYLYRGEIATIAVEGTRDDATLKVTLNWMVKAKADGFPPGLQRWVHVDTCDYTASLLIYTVSDIGDGRLSLSSFIVGETTILFPPGGSTFDAKSAVSG